MFFPYDIKFITHISDMLKNLLESDKVIILPQALTLKRR